METLNAQKEQKIQPKKNNSSFFKPFIQKKLSVGSANDSYEIEADHVADKVMKMSEPSPQVTHSGALLQRKCAHCEQEEKLQMKPLAESISPLIQRSSSSSESGGVASSHVENQINSSRGGGSVMDSRTKNFMENRFGTDFSDVKIHTGSKAVQMSRELNARAFAVGNDIYFNEGKYNPNSDSGKHLLAHELTHTVQQNGGVRKKVQRDYATELSNPDAVFEGFNGEQIDDAIEFNQRQRYSASDIAIYRDVLGLSSEPSVFDEDLINAIGEYQAQNNLTVDGKMRLGGPTARRLARELKAEGRYLGGREGTELIDAHHRLCPRGVKTVTVDIVRLSGSTRAPLTDLSVANRVFRQCCVQFVVGQNVSISLADTQAWLGGNTDLNATGSNCNTSSTEEIAIFNGATAAHSLSSNFRVFYPASVSGLSALAYSMPPYCTGGGFVNHAVIYPNALTDTLAHEFGHILLNSGTHTGIINPASSRNLMFAPGRTASDLDATQCATIFNNA